MYELLYGCPPFNDDTPEKVFDNIISRRIHWPENDEDLEVSDEARDLMERLMCTNPNDRIGARGADEIKRHPFFADINWETICTSEASFVPMVSEEISTDYFDNRGLIELPEGLIELPEELDASSAVPGPIGESPSSVDDFGTFSFRNLSASKAANDQVVMDMSESFSFFSFRFENQLLTTALLVLQELKPSPQRRWLSRSTCLPPSSTSTNGVEVSTSGNEAELLSVFRIPRFVWSHFLSLCSIFLLADSTFSPSQSFLNNPPSPATSSSSGTSSNLPVGLVWQTHSRRTSELDRLQSESDLTRRTSLPSRLRAASTSHGSSEPSPLAFSPASSISSPTSVEATSAGGTPGSSSRVQVLLAEDNP